MRETKNKEKKKRPWGWIAVSIIIAFLFIFWMIGLAIQSSSDDGTEVCYPVEKINGIFKGQVLDKITLEPINNGRVLVFDNLNDYKAYKNPQESGYWYDTLAITTTNRNGFYEFTAVIFDRVFIVIEKEGYYPVGDANEVSPEIMYENKPNEYWFSPLCIFKRSENVVLIVVGNAHSEIKYNETVSFIFDGSPYYLDVHLYNQDNDGVVGAPYFGGGIVQISILDANEENAKWTSVFDEKIISFPMAEGAYYPIEFPYPSLWRVNVIFKEYSSIKGETLYFWENISYYVQVEMSK